MGKFGLLLENMLLFLLIGSGGSIGPGVSSHDKLIETKSALK